MTLDLQRISIKIPSHAASDISLDPFLEIFGRWRADKTYPAEWIDLADYAHVPKGPGIVLIGIKAMFAFDLADPSPGLLYVTRRGLSGSNEERIKATFRSTLDLSKRMIAEKNYPSAAKLRTNLLELRFPDRLVSANSKQTDEMLRPSIDAALNSALGAGAYELSAASESGSCYGYDVKVASAESLDAIRSRLAGSHIVAESL